VRRRIGAVTATPADLYLLAGGFNRSPFAAAQRCWMRWRRARWAPACCGPDGWRVTHCPQVLVVREALQAPALQTRFVMVSRRSDTALTGAVDAALGALQADGSLDAIAARNGLPTGQAAGRQMMEMYRPRGRCLPAGCNRKEWQMDSDTRHGVRCC
jgi:polar amino acid transport system substrate-binding protein